MNESNGRRSRYRAAGLCQGRGLSNRVSSPNSPPCCQSCRSPTGVLSSASLPRTDVGLGKVLSNTPSSQARVALLLQVRSAGRLSIGAEGHGNALSLTSPTAAAKRARDGRLQAHAQRPESKSRHIHRAAQPRTYVTHIAQVDDPTSSTHFLSETYAGAQAHYTASSYGTRPNEEPPSCASAEPD